jgi:hypothetical protein
LNGLFIELNFSQSESEFESEENWRKKIALAFHSHSVFVICKIENLVFKVIWNECLNGPFIELNFSQSESEFESDENWGKKIALAFHSHSVFVINNVRS